MCICLPQRARNRIRPERDRVRKNLKGQNVFHEYVIGYIPSEFHAPAFRFKTSRPLRCTTATAGTAEIGLNLYAFSSHARFRTEEGKRGATRGVSIKKSTFTKHANDFTIFFYDHSPSERRRLAFRRFRPETVWGARGTYVDGQK